MKKLKETRGSVLVFITLMITLLLVMVGIGLDTGQMTYTRATGQAAVDAAAMAAVTALPSKQISNVNARATAFSANNYTGSSGNAISSSNVTLVTYNDSTGAIATAPDINSANGVRVALEQTNPYSGTAANTQMRAPSFLMPLMRMFGASATSSNNVNVSAVAILKAMPGLPIVVTQNECPPSGTSKQTVLLQSNANVDNSCWTGYLDGANNRSIEDLFEAAKTCTGGGDALDGVIDIGTNINLRNGKGSAYDEAQTLFDANPGKCWIVPVVPAVSKCNQGGAHNIADWATICPPTGGNVITVDKKDGINVTLTCHQSLLRTKDNLCFTSELVREPSVGM